MTSRFAWLALLALAACGGAKPSVSIPDAGSFTQADLSPGGAQSSDAATPSGPPPSSCSSNLSVCPHGCADLDNDVSNCGSCGYSCPSAPGSMPTCSAGKCVDVPGANGVDGQYLNLWECNGTAAQNWTFPGDGTIRAFGLCMDVAWGSTADGAVVQLANCSGNPAQQWVLTSAGDLVNPQANKCLDVTGWNSANGTRLETWTCTGGANQKWYRG